jgi:hypothetical protein
VPHSMYVCMYVCTCAGDWGLPSMPLVSSAQAVDSGKNPGFSVGDMLILQFDQKVFPVPVATKAALDAMFNWSVVPWTDYTGWCVCVRACARLCVRVRACARRALVWACVCALVWACVCALVCACACARACVLGVGRSTIFCNCDSMHACIEPGAAACEECRRREPDSAPQRACLY